MDPLGSDTPTEPASDALRRHQAFARAMEGETPFGWDEWGMFVHESRCLTPSGQATASWAVDVLRNSLGADFLTRAREAANSHSIFSPALWPLANDVPWVYANLFRLATQLEVFRTKSRPVRKAMQTNLEAINWVHALLEFEVAGLALQTGWTASFEPKLASGRRGDVRLERGENIFFIEIVSMRMSDVEVQTLEAQRRLFSRIQDVTFREGVHLIGSIEGLGPESDIEAWFGVLQSATTATARDGQPRRIAGPRGSSVEVKRDLNPGDSLTLTGPVVAADPWARLIARLNDKATQAAGSSAVWVRLEELAGIWHFTQLRTMSLQEKLGTLAPFLQRELTAFPGLAGVIVAPAVLWAGEVPAETVHEVVVSNDGSAAAIRAPLPGHRARETVIISNAARVEDTGILGALVDWYRQESTWLDWALEQLGKPPFEELVREPSNEGTQ